MRIVGSPENKIKRGRFWIYFKDYKSIGIEWNLSFEPLQFYIRLNGGEKDYTFSFWFIFTFYITFSKIFKWYPKEWNTSTNNGNGGYLNTAKRRIGITQSGIHGLTIYLWHDGDGDYTHKGKDIKLFYKYINLENIWKGSWIYHTLEEKIYDYHLCLPEGYQKININYRFWHLKYKRWYMKLFNKKGKSILIKSDIKFPIRKLTPEDFLGYVIPPDHLERTMKDEWFVLKENENVTVAIQKYKEKILQLRSCESVNWIPYDYKMNYFREQKLKRIFK